MTNSYLENIKREYEKKVNIDIIFTMCAEKIIKSFSSNITAKAFPNADYLNNLKETILNSQIEGVDSPKLDAFLSCTGNFSTNNQTCYDVSFPLLWFYAKQHSSIFSKACQERDTNLFAKKRQIKARNTGEKATAKYSYSTGDEFANLVTDVIYKNSESAPMDSCCYRDYLRLCQKVAESTNPLSTDIIEVIDKFNAAYNFRYESTKTDHTSDVELIGAALRKIENSCNQKITSNFKRRKETFHHCYHCAQYAIDYIKTIEKFSEPLNLTPHRKIMQLYLMSCTSDILKKTFVMMKGLDMDKCELDQCISLLNEKALLANLSLSEIDIANYNAELIINGSHPLNIDVTAFINEMIEYHKNNRTEKETKFEEYTAEQLVEKIETTISNDYAESTLDLLMAGYLPKEELRKFESCYEHGVSKVDINNYAKTKLMLKNAQSFFDMSYEDQTNSRIDSLEMQLQAFDETLFLKMSNPALSTLFDVN